ncbi:2-oxo acid dehydrogenase subunit E2, partial [bacterium]|nr:2-oxo acid dehydrogenase subunit E2 [bacterium]
ARMAAEHGIPLEGVRGSGPAGRIVKADIETVLSQGLHLQPKRPAAAALQIVNKLVETLTPLDGMRKVIADRMTQAKQTIPHFYLQDRIPMDRVVGLRAALNARGADRDVQPPKLQTQEIPGRDFLQSAKGAARLSYNDFVLMGVSRALMMNPAVNATFDGVGVHTHASVDLAFAVALENGLITPVIKNCDKLGLSDIHRVSEEMAERARRMKLKPDEYMGGTFTVSNLGMYGLDNFSAVINPPQAAILAVAAVAQEPCVDGDGHLYVGWRMGVTLACDHRVLDGAVGAQFLKDLKALLAHPEGWAV